MTTTRSRLAAVLALSMGGVGLLAGCGAQESPDTANATGEQPDAATTTAWEFPSGEVAPSDDVTIAIPDDLREAIGGEADALLINSVRVTPHDIDGFELCAADLEMDYAEGGLETLQAGYIDENDKIFDDLQWLDELMSDLEWDMERTWLTALEEGADRMTEEQKDQFHSLMTDWDRAGLWELANEMTFELESGYTAVVYNLLNGNYEMAKTQDEFSESDPQNGYYVSDDLSLITVVTSCAESSEGQDAAFEFEFRESDADNPEMVAGSPFATVEITVMQSGTIGVSGEIADYSRDAEGNWTAN
ncbi:hypothetical protein [Gulosibacter sp. 10]|uniref:hypothetical protein n=1 Tax=Gulosibacter sp. 10 TaxID=1255570 RepID=UPI001122419E|nr:hypothetical protein [Gulosibacter sp. 10]